jgi:hypothetical protein
MCHRSQAPAQRPAQSRLRLRLIRSQSLRSQAPRLRLTQIRSQIRNRNHRSQIQSQIQSRSLTRNLIQSQNRRSLTRSPTRTMTRTTSMKTSTKITTTTRKSMMTTMTETMTEAITKNTTSMTMTDIKDRLTYLADLASGPTLNWPHLAAVATEAANRIASLEARVRFYERQANNKQRPTEHEYDAKN